MAANEIFREHDSSLDYSRSDLTSPNATMDMTSSDVRKESETVASPSETLQHCDTSGAPQEDAVVERNGKETLLRTRIGVISPLSKLQLELEKGTKYAIALLRLLTIQQRKSRIQFLICRP